MFGFNNRVSKYVEWPFSLNQLWLIILTAVICVGLYFALFAKSEKGKRITKIVLATLILLLQIGAMVWYGLFLSYNGLQTTFGRVIFLGTGSNCATSTILIWTTIFTLYFSAIVKNNNRGLQFLYNVVFGCGMVVGLINILYPDIFDGYFAFFHIKNLLTMLPRILMIFASIYFIKNKEFMPELNNCWQAIFGYLALSAISICFSLILKLNLSSSIRSARLENWGIKLPYPFHILISFAIILIFTLILYFGFYLFSKYKNKNQSTTKDSLQTNDFFDLYSFACRVVAVMQTILFQIILMMFLQKNIGTLWGLLFLLPIGLGIILIIDNYKFKDLAKKENAGFENGNKTARTCKTLLFVGDVILGIMYSKQFKSEKYYFENPENDDVDDIDDDVDDNTNENETDK